jgi:hypothetical protein
MIKAPTTPELSTDPDNTPPRSRLFLVVPKTAEAKVFEVSVPYRKLSQVSLTIRAGGRRFAD